jgi:hypothetical protein
LRTAKQYQAHERQEFAQARKTQRQRIVGQCVYLPAHGDRKHLPAQRGEEAAGGEARKLRVPQHR